MALRESLWRLHRCPRPLHHGYLPHCVPGVIDSAIPHSHALVLNVNNERNGVRTFQ